MCITLLTLPKVNPALAQEISVIKNKTVQRWIGALGTIFLLGFLVIHTYKDFTAEASAWYFHSTPIWLIVMALASILFAFKWNQLKRQGVNLERRFKELPQE
jgi:APA family basic amino acid/polyamine antiporter